jgi:hypothetical protein
MNEVLVKEERLGHMLTGVSRQFISKGKSKNTVGDEVLIKADKVDAQVKAVITNINMTQLRSVTLLDSMREGFPTKEELVDDLKKRYDDINGDTIMTITTYRLENRVESSKDNVSETTPE